LNVSVVERRWHVNEEGKASFALGLDGFRKTGVTDLKSIVKG
jgi:hypothetical protein